MLQKCSVDHDKKKSTMLQIPFELHFLAIKWDQSVKKKKKLKINCEKLSAFSRTKEMS